jgi:hypothetical protein
MADAARTEIKAYSSEKSDFEPYYYPAWQSGTKPTVRLPWWKKIESAFTPK